MLPKEHSSEEFLFLPGMESFTLLVFGLQAPTDEFGLP